MKALVIEDSRLARQGLIRMLEQFPCITVIGGAEDAVQARAVIANDKPDLLFLDIHMPGESGFELLKTLDYTPRIIFTTAYAEYAVQSFEHNTVDYLLKPVSEARLAKAIDKLELASPANAAAQAPLQWESRIFVKDAEACHLLALRSIRYIESCKNYVQIFFDDQKAFVKKSLNQVEQRLPQAHFFRANRQFIVNLHAIIAVDEAVSEGFELTMDDGTVIETSRRNATRLKELLSL